MIELSILLKSSGESIIVGILGGIVVVVFVTVISRVNRGTDKRKLKREVEELQSKRK